MILNVYSVYDKAVGNYLPPLFMRSPGEALRAFSDACNSAETNFYKHAADYTLFMLGVWDDASGLFTAGDPVRVISALECIVRVAQSEAAVEASAGHASAPRPLAQ